MRKRIINWLIKKLLRLDFVSVTDMKRLEAYKRMDNEQTVSLLKAKYTDSFLATIVANSDEDRWMLKGKMLEDLDLINCIENIDSMLVNVNEFKEKLMNKNQTLKIYRDKLVSVFKKETVK